MLLISANLVQLFDIEGLPRGWIRYAWMELSGDIVALAVLVMPVSELRLLTISNKCDNLHACSLMDNSLIPVIDLLRSKDTYHQARVYLIRATTAELHLLAPSEEQTALIRTQPVLELASHDVIWFWDANLSKFAKPNALATESWTENGSWTETVVLAEGAAPQPDLWKQSMSDWKQLTLVEWYPQDSINILFTCFQGHQITNEMFTAYTERVNYCLGLLLNDQVHLTTMNWMPGLMCPISDCCQQLTPSFILKKAVLLHQTPPPVTETTHLLRLLKHKWNL